MPLVLTVGACHGTSIEKFSSEMLHLATVTQCIISTEYEGHRVTVSAGERVEDIADRLRERIKRHYDFFTSKPKTPRV